MMRRHLSQSEVYFELDLIEIFGKAPPLDTALSFGQRIIDEILERTSEGIDREGVPFVAYSKNYIKSHRFAAFDKTADEVNLKLTGNMLSQLDILNFDGEIMRIGIRDPAEAPKAFNHVKGDTLPTRDFLGLPNDTIQNIADEFRVSLETEEIIKDLVNLEPESRYMIANKMLNSLLIDLLEEE